MSCNSYESEFVRFLFIRGKKAQTERVRQTEKMSSYRLTYSSVTATFKDEAGPGTPFRNPVG